MVLERTQDMKSGSHRYFLCSTARITPSYLSPTRLLRTKEDFPFLPIRTAPKNNLGLLVKSRDTLSIVGDLAFGDG